MVSQDRDTHFSGSGRGAGGGGDAGGRKAGPGGGDVSFIRHVPKFLQAHSHLLAKPQSEDDPTVAEPGAVRVEPADDAKEQLDEEEEALRRALELDPALLQLHPELASVAQRAEAAALKDKGNAAFGAGKFEEAVSHFSRCIELDAGNEVYFSNRAAALTSLKRYHEAAADARRVVQLKPRWAKGHSRLGAALLGAEQFAEALEAYEDALELEPEDRALQAALHQALTLQARQEADGKHKFKRKHEGGGGGGRAGQKAAQKPQGAPPPVKAAVKNKALLSFGEDEGGEDF